MALITRVSRLFKADFHAVLDQIEEPELLLKQAIRDMEDELQAAEQRIASCSQECEQLSARKSGLNDTLADLANQLDLCFASGKEDLARGLVRKRLEAERVLKRVHVRLEANAAFLSEQRRLLDENRMTLDGLRQKSEVFANRVSTQSSGMSVEPSWLTGEVNVSEDEVEIAFLQEQTARGAS